MSYFGSALQRWVSSRTDLTITRLAALAGLPQGDLSSIRAGKRRVTYRGLAKLLPVIEAQSDRAAARELLVAYLRDETPEGWAGDLSIAADGGRVEDAGTAALEPLEMVARRWRGRAEKDQDFAAMWLTLDHYMHEPSAEMLEARLAGHAAKLSHGSGGEEP